RFMLLRCGAHVDSVGFNSLGWSNVAADVTEQKLVDEARAKLVDAAKSMGRSGSLVGAAFIRDVEKKTASAFFVTSETKIVLQPSPQSPSPSPPPASS